MRSLQNWLDEYGVSHQNRTNKLVHWLCIPAIYFSIVGLLASIPAWFISDNVPESIAPYCHLGTVVILFVMLFYLRLSFVMFMAMTLWSLFCLWGNAWVGSNITLPLWQFSLIVFATGWILQFIGHIIEGAKPSIFKDVQFLLIGPAWLMAFILKKLRIPY